MADSSQKSDALAIARGGALAEEPGIGALTLPGFLREVCDRHSHTEALVMHHPDGSVERWTYREMWQRAREVAKTLIAGGIGKDERVGVLMSNRLEWVSACFGIALAGGTVVGLSTFATAGELAHLLRASAVSTLLFERHVAGKDFRAMLLELEPAIASARPASLMSPAIPRLRRLAMIGEGKGGALEGWSDFLATGRPVSEARVDAAADSVAPADPALLLFSSGSTGKAKGIINSHRGVCLQSWRFPWIYAVEAEHPVRFWSANGLFWSGNWCFALGGTLAAGGTLVLQPVFNPAEAIALLEAERVTLPYCWPHQWAKLEEQPNWAEADLSSFYYFDAECMLRHPQKTITRSRLDPRASYGSTETFTISCVFPVGTPREVWEGTNGAPLPGNIVKIVDPVSGQTLRCGQTGEIAVKGPTLMIGYVGVPPEEALDEEGFYRAGDGGFIDDRGRLTFQGRINDIIKTGGANVSPVEIDWTLCSCPGVKVCKTTGVPDKALGEMVVSLIAREEGSTLTEAEVITWLKQRLASYKVPRKVVFVTEADLDLTATAKIKPAEARALAATLLARETGPA